MNRDPLHRPGRPDTCVAAVDCPTACRRSGAGRPLDEQTGLPLTRLRLIRMPVITRSGVGDISCAYDTRKTNEFGFLPLLVQLPWCHRRPRQSRSLPWSSADEYPRPRHDQGYHKAYAHQTSACSGVRIKIGAHFDDAAVRARLLGKEQGSSKRIPVEPSMLLKLVKPVASTGVRSVMRWSGLATSRLIRVT